MERFSRLERAGNDVSEWNTFDTISWLKCGRFWCVDQSTKALTENYLCHNRFEATGPALVKQGVQEFKEFRMQVISVTRGNAISWTPGLLELLELLLRQCS